MDPLKKYLPFVILLALLAVAASDQVTRSDFRALQDRVRDLERNLSSLDQQRDFRDLERRVTDLERDVADLNRQALRKARGEPIQEIEKRIAEREDERQMRTVERRLDDLEADSADLLRLVKSHADQLSKLKKEIHQPKPTPQPTPSTTPKPQLPNDKED